MTMAEIRSRTDRVREIIRAVEQAYGLRAGTVIGPSRKRGAVAARCRVFAAIRNAFPAMSYTQIMKMLNRDHTVAIHILKKAQERGGWPDPEPIHPLPGWIDVSLPEGGTKSKGRKPVEKIEGRHYKFTPEELASVPEAYHPWLYDLRSKVGKSEAVRLVREHVRIKGPEPK